MDKTSRTEVKGILVELQLYSQSDQVAKDEPLARRLLERVDVAALAGFLAP